MVLFKLEKDQNLVVERMLENLHLWGECCFTAMLQYVVKDVPPFSFILKNRNMKRAEDLIAKFKCKDENILNLKELFNSKRSGLLNMY